MPEKGETKATGRAEPRPRRKIKEAMPSPAQREAALDQAALQFKALGDPTRLRIIRLLGSDEGQLAVCAGDTCDGEVGVAPGTTAHEGLTVGDVSLGLYGKSKVSSTLSHHLKELRNAGLITMKRRGKNLMCRIHAEAVSTLRCYLVVPDTLTPLRASTHPAPLPEKSEADASTGAAPPTPKGRRKVKIKIKEGGSISDDTGNYDNDAESV